MWILILMVTAPLATAQTVGAIRWTRRRAAAAAAPLPAAGYGVIETDRRPANPLGAALVRATKFTG